MSKFPTNYDQELNIINSDVLSAGAKQAALDLAEKGFEVRYGLTTEFADEIARMALEPAIKEYCPNDCGDRFANREATEKWLSKGRATYLLLKKDETGKLLLAGYGWVGASASSHVPGGETTFAIRVGEIGQGQGLAAPFSRLIIASSSKMFAADKYWLETWQSNGGAVHIYHKLGFEDIDSEADSRLNAEGQQVSDTRLYMSLPNETLDIL